jgi:hypothetical protein
LTPEPITFKISYISTKSAERMKSLALFPKAFSKNKQTLPLHSSGTGGPFGKPKPFLKFYTKTLLKMPKISQI